jgi:hypothetical protein
MALTDISLLFKDIIETPQQKQQRLFAEGQAAAGQYTGLPTGLRALAMGTASGIPGTVESIRQFGAAVGLPVQTQGEQLQRSMGGLNITDRTDQAEMVRLLANINPESAAMAAAIFEENRKETALAKEQSDFAALRSTNIQSQIDARDALARRQATDQTRTTRDRKDSRAGMIALVNRAPNMSPQEQVDINRLILGGRFDGADGLGELISLISPEDDPAKRETAVDINGVRRFIDTGETVFSEVEEVPERDIKEDVNGVKRFVDTGEPIFPSVTPLEEPEKLTSSQRLAAGFAQRTTVSGDIISELGDQFIGFMTRGVGVVPQGLRFEDRQRFDQATEDFINATLRRESGAAINPSEFVSANSQYIPQVGDKEAVLEQKRKNREVISASLQLEAGEAFVQLQDVLAQKTVIVLGQEYEVGQIVENEDGQQGRIEADGSITPL